MTMKQFMTKTKEVSRGGGKDRETLDFKIDDRQMVSKRPTEAQIGYMVAVQSGGIATDDEYMASIINFMVAILDHDGQIYVRNRLLDGDDDFELDDVVEIVEWLMEEWTARPTRPSSDSTSSSQTSGDGSTEIVDAEESTSSVSTQKELATSSTPG